jgi:hypothetical protein
MGAEQTGCCCIDRVVSWFGTDDRLECLETGINQPNDAQRRAIDAWLYGPMPVTLALLTLDPIWDPLRADPTFQKLCEEKQK